MKQGIREKELLQRLGALPREITPKGDAWTVIAQRIGQDDAPYRQQSSSRWWMNAVAASVAVVFIAGLLIGRQRDMAPEIAQPGFDLTNQVQSVLAGGLTGALTASELEYRAAFREFVSVGDFRQSMPHQAVENLITGWADLNEVESVLTNALRDNPGDSFLTMKMMKLRARQLNFLQQLASFDQNSRRMTI